MSLNWNLKEIANYKDVCFETYAGTQEEMLKMLAQRSLLGSDWSWTGDDHSAIVRMSPLTFALVWGTVAIKMGSIRPDSWRDFYTRIHIYERTSHPLLMSSAGGPIYITPSDVHAHIGLTTNVDTEPASAFSKSIMRSLSEAAKRQLSQEEGV